MEARITKKLVDGTEPKARDVFVWDDILAGFGLKVTPSGAKVYLLQYRSEGGGRGATTKRFTIGRHGSPWTPDKAREEARRLLALIAEGRDPMAEKKSHRAAAAAAPVPVDTVPLAIDRFIQAYSKKNAPRHWREVERTLKYDPARVWADRDVASIGPKDVAKLLESIVARGAPSQANHVHRVLTTFFNCCASPVIALVPTSPMVGVERPAVEVSRERVLEDWELALIWRAAVAQGYPFGPCIQLLMLTAQRRDEVAQMTRSEVDFDKALWTLPAARSKNGKANLIPLPPRSLEILQQLPWTHELAFTTTGRTAISGFSRLKDRLDWAITNLMKQDAQAAGRDPSTVQPLAHWTYHDFRRTASSNLARLGVPLHVTEKLLNHQPQAIRGVAAIYNRYEYLDERREALERWEAQVRQITAGWDDTSRVSSGLPTALAFKPPGKRSTLR